MPQESEAKYPTIVRVYRQRYDTMAEPGVIQKLKHYSEDTLNDPIHGLDWKELLTWQHRHLKYTREQLPEPRAEMPIDIIAQSGGRCGEFALLYNGLLLANGYECRLLIDCSTLNDKWKQAAGDHVWNEVLINGSWVHVDPTERRINEPLMYFLEWKKDVNLVYAIARKETLNVTTTYRIAD